MTILSHQNAGQTVSLNGIELYYETYGSGYPLLLLHGFTGSSAGLATLFQSLIPTHQLIIPDLRGHGRSSNPSDHFTHREAAEDISALLSHLKIDKFCAIGFSAGANVLLHMATQTPERFRSMALVSGTPYFPEQARQAIREMTAATRTQADWEAMRKIHIQGDEQITKLWQQAKAFAGSTEDMNLTPADLAKITAKTLIVQGDRDPLYPAEMSLAMYQQIPNAYLWILPNAGHGALNEAQIPDFIKTIESIF